MPYIGQDWRSPGEMWVRTTEGWERMRLWRAKIFENLGEIVVARVERLNPAEAASCKDLGQRRQPFVIFSGEPSREKNESTSLCEAIVQLDMCAAVKDVKRANFIVKMLFLIFAKKLPTLSGTSQKLVLNILESMVNEAIKTELNLGLMKELVDCTRDALRDGRFLHIGSDGLWSRHAEIVEKLSDKLTDYNMNERKRDGRIMLSDLPQDCLRVIFSSMPDHKDVMRAGQTSSTLNRITEESCLWREMCLFHFTNKQLLTFLPKDTSNLDINWKYIYKRCYKRFGKKDTYADMLAICTHCNSIHWKSLGHPCIGRGPTEAPQDLSPEAFLHLFKV